MQCEVNKLLGLKEKDRTHVHDMSVVRAMPYPLCLTVPSASGRVRLHSLRCAVCRPGGRGCRQTSSTPSTGTSGTMDRPQLPSRRYHGFPLHWLGFVSQNYYKTTRVKSRNVAWFKLIVSVVCHLSTSCYVKVC